MKAYSAHCAHATNGRENAVSLDSMMDSSTSSTASTAAPSQPSGSAEVAASSPATKPKPVKFHLDSNARLKELWAERAYWRSQFLTAQKWLDKFDDLLADAMGDAEEVYVDNTHVATYTNNGSFRKKAFLAEQPELAEQCMTYELVFSLEKLKAIDPKAYANYRARAMHIKDKPKDL